MRNWTWRLSFLLWATVCGQDPGPPTWPDGSILTITAMGLGSVLLTWPVAENNVYELIGYKVYMTDSAVETASTSMAAIFDGVGNVAIRQFLVTGLVPGNGYSFFIEALNTDPTYTVVLSSSYLFRSYTLATPIGLDPTTLGGNAISLTAGTVYSLAIAGKQPNTGNLQDIGPICLVTERASCVPGRTFVAFIEPVCYMTNLNSQCKPVNEGSALFNSFTLPYTKDYYGPLSVAYDENNVGQYTVELNPERAGSLSLGLQAVTPNQLLGLYWNNPSFLGDPADTRADSMIDFYWGEGSIVAWVSEFVSVRWLGFIKPESSGLYSLGCWANTYCDVWINDEHIIPSSETQTACTGGCNATSPLQLHRSHYYKLRVDYVTTLGESYVSLRWKDRSGLFASFTAIPSQSFQRGAYLAQAPVSITVNPGKMRGIKSTVYGTEEAMLDPQSGKIYTLFVQLKDEFGNPCTSYNTEDELFVAASGNNSFVLRAKPYNVTVPDCVHAVQLSYKKVGSTVLKVSLNGEPVSNSPLVQYVSPGVVSPLASTLDDVSYSVSHFFVNSTFNVSIVLRDVFGNANPEIPSTTSIRYRLSRNGPAVGCGNRSEVTWTVYCWTNEFTYMDDSLVIAQSYRSFTDSTSNVAIAANGTLTISGLRSYYTGPHSLTVYIGDTLVTGGVIILDFMVSLDQAVNASMSLVQFMSPSMDISQVTVIDTDVSARVLLRDSAGNALTDRPNVDVRLAMNYTATNVYKEFLCEYVDNKYYQCIGYADQESAVHVSVIVNGTVASMASGTIPPTESCAKLPFCGTTACPCNQRLIPATRSLDVLSV